jgi:hypothetical protein
VSLYTLVVKPCLLVSSVWNDDMGHIWEHHWNSSTETNIVFVDVCGKEKCEWRNCERLVLLISVTLIWKIFLYDDDDDVMKYKTNSNAKQCN